MARAANHKALGLGWNTTEARSLIEELFAQSTHGPLIHVFEFIPVQAAGAQSSDVLGLLQQHHRQTLPCGGDRRGDAARSASINDDIIRFSAPANASEKIGECGYARKEQGDAGPRDFHDGC